MFNKKEYHKEWNKKYYQEHKEQAKEYYQNNKKKILEDCKKYRQKNKDHCKKYHEQRRLEVLNIISGGNPHCIRCGCDDIRLLEINHKNGGGQKEIQRGKLSTKFYNDIRKGERKTNDLEILCRICNAWHYLESKFGKLPYDISYNKGGNK